MTQPGAATAVHVVVVGSGIAGLTAARTAAVDGCRVTLVTKASLEESNTRYAQGGIAAATSADDTVAAHVRDTLAAGAGLSEADAATVLATEGAERVRDLVALGVPFDRDDRGELRRGLEAAHSVPRVLHAGGDATGAAIEQTLATAVRRLPVTIIEHAFLVDLVVESGGTFTHGRRRCTGVDLLVGGERRRLHADAVVLATGGAGALYAHTTNPAIATGDGIAAALRAGATVSDLEFVQFHPTALPATASDGAFLVSEAVRGEGAVLRDESGRRFAVDADPRGELAPRDVVARAIAAQMVAQGGRAVLLDATGLRATPAETAAFLAERFPTIDAAVRARGLDWAREGVPVTPAAHYLMGGVCTDLDGRTDLPGVYAAGETARTGVHGANRLASNSLLEGAVFGTRVGAAIRGDASVPWPTAPPAVPAAAAIAAATDPTPEPVPAADAPPFSRALLQQLMWRHAGLVRDAAGLSETASVLSAWRASLPAAVSAADHEDANLLLVASRVVSSALARDRSIGAHHRSDTADVAAVADAVPSTDTAALRILRRAKTPATDRRRKVSA